MMRVQECGESECHPVMGWTGVELFQQHHSTRKRADSRMVFQHEIT
ncbi:hypothetical protein EC50588_A0008 [Escherichia coli 5.0588]|nr:hypothetical protein EC50588_A0008 [Escherichia coli 5.0588]